MDGMSLEVTVRPQGMFFAWSHYVKQNSATTCCWLRWERIHEAYRPARASPESQAQTLCYAGMSAKVEGQERTWEWIPYKANMCLGLLRLPSEVLRPGNAFSS